MHTLLKKIFMCVWIGLMLVSNIGMADELIIPAPPELADKAHVLIDAATGQILVGNNEHEKLPPASLTKLMTTYIVEDQLAQGKIKPQDLVTISEKAWRTEGSRSFLNLNSQVPVIDLLRGVIIQSGNDASMALAEYVAGSDTAFADLMNQQAQKLEMKDTHFMNPDGLNDPNHYSTPYDLAILSKAIIDNHPDYYKIYAEKEFLYNGIKQGNRNTLLYKDSTVDGLKTGHTEAAGYCLAASAVRSGMRLISVVMGATTMRAREEESAKLLDYGFRYFQTNKLYTAGQVLQTVRVWKGVKNTINLGTKDAFAITLPRGQETDLKTIIMVQGDLTAPISTGQTVGKIDVMLKDKLLTSIPLVALDSVDEANFFKRIWDDITLFFHKLMS